MNLGDIEILTKSFAETRAVLAERVQKAQMLIATIKLRRLPGIKSAINEVTEKQSALKTALEEGRSLFIRPKTLVMHGVKVGFQKAKGKISWADDDQVVKLIKKHLPDQADILIKTTEKPIKDALANLSAADLKRIGVTVEDTSDQVVIKSTDSEIDKFVEALLKDDTKEQEAA